MCHLSQAGTNGDREFFHPFKREVTGKRVFLSNEEQRQVTGNTNPKTIQIKLYFILVCEASSRKQHS